MHRNRTWTLDPPDWRTQRNRLLPIEGGDGSTLNLDFTSGVLDPRFTFTRDTNATFVNAQGYVQYALANMQPNTNFDGITGTTYATLGWGGFVGTGATFERLSSGVLKCKAATSGAVANSNRAFLSTTATIPIGLPITLKVTIQDKVVSSTLDLVNFLSFTIATTSYTQYRVIGVKQETTFTGVVFGDVITLTVIPTQANGVFRVGLGCNINQSLNNYVTIANVMLQQGEDFNSTYTYLPNSSTTVGNYSTPRFDNTILTSRTNYIKQSNSFTTTPWAQKDGTHLATVTAAYEAAPFGLGGTATRITSSNENAGIKQVLSLSNIAGKIIVVSFYAKSNKVGNQNFAVTLSSSITLTTEATTVWQRFGFVSVNPLTEVTLFGGFFSTDTLDLSIFGFQVEYVPTATVATDYIPTTTLPVTVNTTEPRGLLFEGTTINYALYSNAPGTAGVGGWSPGGTATITIDGGAPAPDGITTSTRLQFPAIVGATVSRIYQETGYPLASYPYTMSVWMKSNTETNQTINILGSANTNNVVTPTWQRFVVTVTASASLYRYFYISNESTTVATDISIWGAQLEGGVGASSYVPTGSSQSTRNADSCIMNNIESLNYSTQTGTIYWRGIINKQPTTYVTLIGFMTAGDVPTFETFGNALSYFTAARGSTLTGGGSNEVSRTYTLNSTIRYASSINTLVNPIIAVNLNGSAGSTNKAGTGNMHLATRFVIGRGPSHVSSYPSATIQQIRYYPTAKTAAELQALIT